MDRVKEGYEEEDQATKLIEELKVAGGQLGASTLSDGLIRHHGRAWLGSNKLAHHHILQAMHNSGVGGHSGFTATYYRVKKLFCWPGMKHDIQEFIASCQVCQQAKIIHAKLARLLQPLPVPKQAWHTVCLDFVEGLPKSNRYDIILVVIDKFSKYGHFIPLSHPYIAMQVVQLYLDQVYRLHGLPQQIVFDRDRIFTSSVWL